MSSLNKVQLIGRIGKDPEIRTTQSGSRVASFSMAMSESWKDKATGEKKEKTEWVNIVVWNDHLVGVVERFVKKGGQLYVEGKLQTRKWTHTDGGDRYTTEVVLANYDGDLKLLGGKNSDRPPANEGPQDDKAKTGGQGGFADDLDDEIPF